MHPDKNSAMEATRMGSGVGDDRLQLDIGDDLYSPKSGALPPVLLRSTFAFCFSIVAMVISKTVAIRATVLMGARLPGTQGRQGGGLGGQKLTALSYQLTACGVL